MWIVKNNMRAIIKIEGSPVEIAPGDEIDLDAHGRENMEALAPLAVAFEEGYLENVFKDSLVDVDQESAEEDAVPAPTPGMSNADFEKSLAAFKASIVDEIRAALPGGEEQAKAAVQEQLGVVRDELRAGMKDVLESLGKVRERLVTEKARLSTSSKLSESEVKARLAFLEETEQRLKSNFERVGLEIHSVNEDDGPNDVLDNADLLSSI